MSGENKQQHYYRLSAQEVLEQLHSTSEGISSAEAQSRLGDHGSNTLKRAKHELAIVTFLRQFKNLLVLLLLTSAVLSIFLKDGKTAAILIAIALMNTLIGFLQEHKAETLMKSLENLMQHNAKVFRDGKLEEIDSTEIAVGDVLYIEEGDSVPADIRIIDENELGTNDFALTGESNPSRKFVHAISGDVILGRRHNLAFMGTTVATGSGHGVVIGTGMQTELGRIANLSQGTQAGSSPLQKEMSNLAIRITQGTIILAVVLTFFALKANLNVHDAVLFGIAISAAMIPSGLVAEVNITLSQAAGRLAKAKALVKKLSAVETLGATNYILTDKTGTLTKNEMTVEKLLIGRSNYSVSGTGYEANGEILDSKGKKISQKTLNDLELFFLTASLSSNAKVDPPDQEHNSWYVVGDPTEGALITLARKAGMDTELLNEEIPELKEFQFDSARKLLSSVRVRNGQNVVFVKGAPENLLELSTDIWDHGHIRKLTAADRKFFTDYDNKNAKSAMRNLAFGYRILPKGFKTKKPSMEKVEQDFIFLGIASMIDPLREAVPDAMKAARGAHVKVSIITGDSAVTAYAIALKAGLAKDITVIEGDELPGLADSQIMHLVERGGAVFSRVAPEDKLRIVELVRQSGHVVAVTGDGINDAPALKRADIGVAMGKTGTDVAKDAAEIILLDDSFDTLVDAIEEGRLTFQNIRKAARCALTDNASELLVTLFGLTAVALFHVAPALPAIQILAIDIVAQILPITALGWDRAQHNLMREKPRDLHDHIVSKSAILGFIGFGLLAALLAYANYLYFFVRHDLSPQFIPASLPLYHQATTLTYLTLVLSLYIYLMFERASAHERFFTSYLWSNKKLLVAFGISFFLIGNVIYNPWIQPYFSTASLDLMDLMTAIVCAGIYTAFRLAQRHTRKHTRHNVIKLHHEVHAA